MITTLIIPWPGKSDENRTESYRACVAREVIAQGCFNRQISGVVKVCYSFSQPDRVPRCMVPILTIAQDALVHAGVFSEACRIDEITVARDLPLKGGRIFVRITESGRRA
jgi:Holliday junction resolvase RusA-like endonuclease